jgi:hypothetical protein
LPAWRRAHWELGLGRASFGLGDLDALERHGLQALELLGQPAPRTRAQWLLLLGRQIAAQLTTLVGVAGKAPDPREGQRDAALAAGLLSERYFYHDDVLRMATMVLLAINVSERGSGTWAVPRAYSAMGGLTRLLRLHTLSSRYFARAHAAAQAAGDLSEQTTALAVEAVTDGSLGRTANALATADRLRTLLPRLRDPVTREYALTTLCHIDLFLGYDDTAKRHADDLLASARQSGHVQHAMWGRYFVARGQCLEQRWATAIALLERARQTLRDHPETQSEINCGGLLALSHWQAGRHELAQRLADETLARIQRSRPTGFPSLCGYAAVAETYRRLAETSDGAGAKILRQRHTRTRRALWRFAMMFPAALPTALLESGYARAVDARLAARALFQLSRRCAERFGIVPDVARARAALAELGAEGPRVRSIA